MMRLRIRADLRCPKHLRFSGGDPGAVKAGCPACQDLFATVKLAEGLERRVGYFQPDYVPAVEGKPAKVA